MSLLGVFSFSYDIYERSPLAGDDLLPNARAQVTHQVEIQAPPTAVWPWLVQMGRRRGGWYSWDFLDNGGVRSADRILPEFQSLAVGDVLPVKPTGPDGFTVLALEAPRALVLGDPSLLPGRRPRNERAPRATWSFSLEPSGELGTKLAVRVRVDYERSPGTALLRPLVAVLHEIMVRKQLRTLKRRIEANVGAARRDEPGILKRLVGSGDRIGLFVLPFLLAGLLFNVLYPGSFDIDDPPPGLKLFCVPLLASGIVVWAWSVVLILLKVPRHELITSGPYAWVKHPLYTSVALLVLPTLGFLFESWLGALLGVALYVGSRLFSPQEERDLAKAFGTAWDEYLKRLKIPWL